MTRPLRLLFDECLPTPTVEALARMLAGAPEKPQIAHILEDQKQGVPDQEWIPRVAGEGWIVITADRGKRNVGGKLPILCRMHSITHVMLSGKVHAKKAFEKARMIVTVWPELVKLADDIPGSGYSLRLTGVGQHPHLVRLYGGNPPAPDQPTPTRPPGDGPA